MPGEPPVRNRERLQIQHVLNVVSDVASIVEWMNHLKDQDLLPRFIAMDNEPELWGYTHYDVHPDCTTFEEVLDKYLAYASAIREVAPKR